MLNPNPNRKKHSSSLLILASLPLVFLVAAGASWALAKGALLVVCGP